jgi:hypothetical protein
LLSLLANEYALLQGKTALMAAAKTSDRHWLRPRESQLLVLKELLAAGADVDATDADGNTAFDLATREEEWAALSPSTNAVDVLRQSMDLPSRFFLLSVWAILSAALCFVAISFNTKLVLCIVLGAACFVTKGMRWTGGGLGGRNVNENRIRCTR